MKKLFLLLMLPVTLLAQNRINLTTRTNGVLRAPTNFFVANSNLLSQAIAAGGGGASITNGPILISTNLLVTAVPSAVIGGTNVLEVVNQDTNKVFQVGTNGIVTLRTNLAMTLGTYPISIGEYVPGYNGIWLDSTVNGTDYVLLQGGDAFTYLNAPYSDLLFRQANTGIASLTASGFNAKALTATNGVFGAYGCMTVSTGAVTTGASAGPNNITNFNYLKSFGSISTVTNTTFLVSAAGDYRISFGSAVQAGNSDSCSLVLITNNVICSVAQIQATMPATAQYETAFKEVILTLPANTYIGLATTNSDTSAQLYRNTVFNIGGAN